MPTDTAISQNDEILDQIKWMIRLRWVAVISIFLSAVLIRVFFAYYFLPVFITAVIVSTYNYIIQKDLNRLLNSTPNPKAVNRNLQAQIVLDLLVITGSIHLTGGAESKIISFYFVHIPLVSLAVSRRTLINYVILISLFLAILFGLEYYDILPHKNLDIIELFAARDTYKNPRYLFKAWMLSVLFLSLSAYITNYIRVKFQSLLKSKEKALLESESLRNVAFSLSTALKWEETVNIILDSVNQLTTFDVAMIVFIDAEEAKIIAGRGIPAKLINTSLPMQEKCREEFINKKQCLIKKTSKGDKSFWDVLGKKNIQSSLCVPMIAHGVPLGVLAIGSKTPDLYQQKDAELVHSLGNYAAISLANSQLYENTREQALKDGLTGLSNRRSLQDNLEREEARTRRYGYSLSLLMCDLDKFKAYNDHYGHLAGDDLLRSVSELMLNTVRTEDQVFRYGGEEFTILLPETGKEQALALAERLRERIEEHEFTFQDSREKTHITLSIGLSVFPNGVEDTQSLLQAADEALYRAKEKRNTVVCYADIEKKS